MTKMGRPTIRDGAPSSNNSDTERSRSDDLSDHKMGAWEAERFVKRMVSSSDKVDNQLLNLFKVRQKTKAFKTI